MRREKIYTGRLTHPSATMIARTPPAPYYAVIFTSVRTGDDDGYDAMSERMSELAHQQAGFLGVESARNELGITVSYWKDLASIKAWKADVEHLAAQKTGRSDWYARYTTRIAKVERDYSFAASGDGAQSGSEAT